MRALWRGGVKQGGSESQAWDPGRQAAPRHSCGVSGTFSFLPLSTSRRTSSCLSREAIPLCPGPPGWRLTVPSRDAELHCPSWSLGTRSRSPSRWVAGRSPGVLAPVLCFVCSRRLRLKLLGWRDVSPKGSKPRTVIFALQHALLLSSSAAPTAAPAAARRRRSSGKGLSFKSMLSTVIRISYHPCHCNGWD